MSTFYCDGCEDHYECEYHTCNDDPSGLDRSLCDNCFCDMCDYLEEIE